MKLEASNPIYRALDEAYEKSKHLQKPEAILNHMLELCQKLPTFKSVFLNSINFRNAAKSYLANHGIKFEWKLNSGASIKLEAKARLLVSADAGQEAADAKFMAYLRKNDVRATRKSLNDGDVIYWMKSPKKMIIESDRWTKMIMDDERAAQNGMKDLEGVKAFFTRFGVGPSKKR